LVAAAATKRPALALLHGPGACVSMASVPGCARTFGDTNPVAGAAISPDGSSIYIPSGLDTFVSVLARDRTTGRLAVPKGQPECLRATYFTPRSQSDQAGAQRCQVARGFGAATNDVAVSPDARNVYITSDLATSNNDFGGKFTSAAIAIFARASNGALTQLPGSSGCIASAALDDCTILPGLTASSVSISPDGLRVYTGGSALTTFARDPSTGALGMRACLSGTPMTGCGATPLGLPLLAPLWRPDGRYAYGTGANPPRGGGPSTLEAIFAFGTNPMTGLLAPLAGPGACATRYRNPGCPLDKRLGSLLSSLAITRDGRDLYVATTPQSYSLPPPRGTPFDLLAFRLNPSTGAMSRTGAACLSTTRRPGCKLDPKLGDPGSLAVSPGGRRVYAATSTDVLALSRQASNGSIRLIAAIHGCGSPFAKCRRSVQPINEPHQVLVSPDGRFVYAISSSFADTGTIATLAVR
jgi:WD40 repeat protein